MTTNNKSIISPPNSKAEDLDLFDLLFLLYKYKLVIFLVVIIGTLISSFIILSNKTKYEGTIKVRPFSPIFNSDFYSYNSLYERMHDDHNKLSNTIYNQKNEIRYEIISNNEDFSQKLNASFFYREFFEELSNRKILKENILEELILEKPDMQKELLEKEAWKLTNNFNIIENQSTFTKDKINNYQLGFDLMFVITNKLKTEKIIKKTFTKINSKIREKTLKVIQTSKKYIQLENDRLSTLYKDKLEKLNKEKLYRLQENIKFLKRHYKTAKNLKIYEDKFDYNTFNLDSKLQYLGDDLNLELNYFRKGTKLIKNQIEIFDERIKFEITRLNNKYKTNSSEYFHIIDKDLETSIDNEIKKLPLSNENFRASNYELNNIQYYDISNKLRSITIAFLISLILGIIIAIYVNVFKQKNLKI